MPDDETIDQVSPSYADVLFANALELEGDQTVTTGPRPGARGGEQPGQLIGRYTLVEVLGEGGFGSVWRAEQSEPVARQVALKIIKLGMDSREIITRFEQERQALAMMDHPHIAKIFDAGVTDAGRPYFVMELVHGEPMTTYCDCNRLTIRHRLELFIQVCQAIQHAHQKGVIHRDLKPSNILVAEHDGVPGVRVIDFGVAKATERSLTAETLQTIAGQVIGTPGYMSPEQADPLHLDIDTRSDVYSLGAVLYELLTGTLPLDEAGFAHAALEAILRRIREQDPPRPSNRITSLAADKQATTAQRRGMEATRLPHAVRGDLDWIVMKCLEKDRQRRYETVSGLAADVQRHLNDEPITARPPSAAYVAGRTIRRHKLAFAAAAVILLTLVMGIVISTSFYLRAETRRVEAQQARFEQEKLKAAATDAAAKFQRTATTADYQLATRTLATNPDFDYASMDYIARALETDPTNHSATALGMQQMMSRPRMLIRRAADPASALSSTEYIRKETYGEWRPEDILARDAVSMLRAPATTLTEPAGHPLIRNMALPLERWISAQDYPQGYSFHLYAMINGWHGHIARQTCLNEFEVCCVISPDRRHVLAVNKQGRWSLYRHEKDHPSQVSSGTFKDWPAADLGERDFYLFIDGGLQWVARGSYSIRTGANNPACGLWSLATGERVVNTITNPLKGVITVGFHPSGSLAAMGTFGRKLVLVDLATKKPLPFEKTYLGINSYTWITPDGLDISTGKESDGWGGEIMGLCSGHAAVPVHTSSSFEGRPFESGFRYRANHITSSPETEKEDAWLRALPEVHCGGMTPAILSLNASPNVIQWDKEGDIVFWCEGDKVFCKASLSSLSKPSAATALHEVKTAPVKHFKISHPLDQMVYTTREGLGFASLGKGLETLKEDAFVREAGLGRVALNHALGRGCVVQRVQMNDVLRTIDLRQRTLLGGHTAVWGEKAADKEAAIRDLEFSPDGALLLVNGTGVPAYQLMSSAFLEIGPVNDFRLAGRQLATFMGTDVAWDTSGRFFARSSSGGGCYFHRLKEGYSGGGLDQEVIDEGNVDKGVCIFTAFLPQASRYVLSACNETKTVRLCDRELKEIIAEWPFVTNIDALEVSPAGDRFAVITSKRLEVYWLPPVDETAPEWFPSLMRHLAYRKQTPAEQIAVLAALEKQISRATPGNDQAPRLLESVRWALADTRLRPVLPGMAMKLADQFEDILPRADAVLRQRLLNKLIVQGVRTAAIYREAARHPPEGMSAESLKKWGDYYNSLADDFKSAEPAKADQPLSPPRQRQVRLPADKPAWVDTRSPRWQFEKAEVFIQKSTFLRARKQPEDAAKNAEAGLTIMQRLTEQEPQNTKWAASLATCHHKLGMALRDQKDLAKAELHFQKASQIMARLISQDPKQNEWLHKLASINSWQASNALDQENWKDASRFWDGAARAYEQILALDPEDNAAKLKVADYLNLMAISLGRQGRHAEAVVVVKRSLAILEELGAANQLTGDSIHWLQRARNDLVSFQKALEVKSSPQKTKL